jgi:hypothetical protein
MMEASYHPVAAEALVEPKSEVKRRPSERSRISRVERFIRTCGAGSESFRFGFAAIELADDIGANAPERLLVGLRFLAFAVSASLSP